MKRALKRLYSSVTDQNMPHFKTTLKELALFVEKEHKGGQDIGYILREMKDIKLTEPTKLPTTADEYDKAVWAEDYEEYREKKRKLEELKSMTYALVLGQCSPGVMTKLEGQEKYAEVKANWDRVGLLQLIQAICCNFKAKTKPYWALTG